VSKSTGFKDTIRVYRAFGEIVEGEALVSTEGFSPRYDLDRWSGLISRPGHALEGHNIRDKILITPSAKGGIAAGWAFYDIRSKGIAPKAFVFGVNPLGVQLDGALSEGTRGSGGGFSGLAQGREAPDLNPDYVFQSKGHVTESGYEVEIRIPFKSVRYQSSEQQD